MQILFFAYLVWTRMESKKKKKSNKNHDNRTHDAGPSNKLQSTGEINETQIYPSTSSNLSQSIVGAWNQTH